MEQTEQAEENDSQFQYMQGLARAEDGTIYAGYVVHRARDRRFVGIIVFRWPDVVPLPLPDQPWPDEVDSVATGLLTCAAKVRMTAIEGLVVPDPTGPDPIVNRLIVNGPDRPFAAVLGKATGPVGLLWDPDPGPLPPDGKPSAHIQELADFAGGLYSNVLAAAGTPVDGLPQIAFDSVSPIGPIPVPS